MSTPLFTAPTGSVIYPSDKPDFGPDASSTPKNPPKINQKNPPKASPLSNLGANQSVRSGVRKLTEDDQQKIVDWYLRIAKMCKLFHPRLHIALTEQAEDCAQSWVDLADKNDKVRKRILAVLEGGEWGKLFAAHVPLLIAVLPASVIERYATQAFQLFAQQTSDDETDLHPDEYNSIFGNNPIFGNESV